MGDEIIISCPAIAGKQDCIALTLADARLHALYDPYRTASDNLFGMLSGQASFCGNIAINGKPVKIQCPYDAMQAGIGGYEQIINSMTLLQNLKLFVPDMSEREIKLQAEKYPMIFSEQSLRKRADTLSPLDRVRFTILRSLIRHDRLILLYYPFSGLTDKEKHILKACLIRCSANGRQVLYTSDAVDDTVIAEEMSCVFDGKLLYSGSVSPQSADALMKFTRSSPPFNALRRDTIPGGVLMAARSIWVDRKPEIRDVTLEIREGEITGIVYAPGSGETSLTDCFLARIKPDSGRVINSLLTEKATERALLNKGLRYIPSMNQPARIISGMRVYELAAAMRSLSTMIWSGGILQKDRARELSEYLIRQFSLSFTPDTYVSDLSQMDIRLFSIASELTKDGPVLIAYDLFDGLDPHRVSLVSTLLQKDRNQKKGILLLSQRLSTLTGTADRICYLRDHALQPYIPS